MDVTTLDSKLREMGDSDSGYGSEDASLENGLALQVTITDDTPKRLLNSDHPDWSERAVAKSGLWIVGPCYNFEEFFGKQKHRRMLYRCPEGDLIYNRKAREVAFKPAAIRDGSGGEDGSEEDESEGEEQTGWGVRHRKYAGVQFLAAELSRTRLYAREHGLRSTGNRCDWRLSPLRDLSNKGPLLEVTSPEGETRYLIPPAWDTTAVIGGDKDAECGGGRYRRYWSTKHLEPEQSRTRIHVREHGLLSMGNQCDWRRSVLRDPFNQGPTLEVTDPEGETRYLVPPAWDSVSVWDNDDEGDDWEDDEDEQ
ncbi:hypothetical protein NKR23_g16 [Pleurostoma richardsiae]|uniref:Uncharacterized protein n=1 Tax=Pleurostoma richardsiae TaxID=41990 RepID=A0AA38S7Y3_9PEZI|nr:hypothetical protein NKR23_g16 [Pleurostoma richardsiae]